MPSPRPRRRRPHEVFRVPMAFRRGPRPGPEILPWYWHPQRDGAQPAPAAFQERLKAIDPDLGVVFSPVHERWLIWVKNPRIQHPLCCGWQLLFLWEHPVTHEYLPLTELVFHNLMLINRDRFPNAKAYYEKIEKEVAEKRAAREKDYQRDRQALQRDLMDMHRISSAGTGSRAPLHHDGTTEPSPGHAAWLAETKNRRLPSDVLRQEQEDREKAFYGR